MADSLAALEALEAEDKAQRKTTKTTFKNTKFDPARRTSFPLRFPESTKEQQLPSALSTNLSPKTDEDGRRISFANTSGPLQRRFEIPTRTASLASGFPYDPKLNEFNVSEAVWKTFSDQVIEAAAIPLVGASIFKRKLRRDVISNIKMDLRHKGHLTRVLKKWNQTSFQEKGFQVSLELPDPPKHLEDDMRKFAGQEANTVRIGITPNVESRDSSLTGSASLIFDDSTLDIYETGTESASELDVSDQLASKGAKKTPARQTSIKDIPFRVLPSLRKSTFEDKVPELGSQNEAGSNSNDSESASSLTPLAEIEKPEFSVIGLSKNRLRDPHVYSQSSSMTESSAPEDATDWEEDSDVESCSRAFDAKGQADSAVSTVLDPIKKQMVDRLMEEFWIIFSKNWPTGARKCPGAPAQGHTTKPASTSELSTGLFSDENPGGRQTRSNRDEEDLDEGPAKRPGGNGKQPESASSTNQVPLGFACPYRKRNPRKYCVGNWRSCALSSQKTVARVKGHLYRYHIIHQCQRCKNLFESEQELDSHIETSETCDAIVAPPVDGVTRKMKALLQCKRKAFPGQTEADRWKQVYQILFPLDEEVPDPYFEPLRDNEENEPLPPDPTNLTNYEDFLRRMLPQFVRSAFENQINSEVQPIEDRLRGQIMDVIEQAQNRAFQEYRDMMERRNSTDPSVDSGYASNPTTSTSSLDKKRKGSARNVAAEPIPSMAGPEIISNLPEPLEFPDREEDTTFGPKSTGHIQQCLPPMNASEHFHYQEAISDDFLHSETFFSRDLQQSHGQSPSHVMDLDSVDWAHLLEEDLNSM